MNVPYKARWTIAFLSMGLLFLVACKEASKSVSGSSSPNQATVSSTSPEKPVKNTKGLALTLKIAIDKDYRAVAGWKDKISRDVKVLNRIFKQNFDIGFKVVKIVEWNLDTSKLIRGGLTPLSLKARLKKDVATEGYDFVVGYTGLPFTDLDKDHIYQPGVHTAIGICRIYG